MNHKTSKDDFDPSLHVIPLEPKTRTPVLLVGEAKDDNTLVAITDNGRISFFPVEANVVFLGKERIVGRTFPLVRAISARIDEHFPNEKDVHGNHINQFLAVGVMLGSEGKEAKFIFEVLGFLNQKELDVLYSKLNSLLGTKVGDKEYKQIENYLSSEPVRKWVNELIASLKKQLDWSNYVRGVLGND